MAENGRRVRHLPRARAALAHGPNLRPVLREVVTEARELVGARYAALGMVDEDGQLGEFVYEGMDEHAAGLVGALPQGHGLLGQLLGRATPIRLDDLTEHPGAAGFPSHHPAMKSFLGVPIRIQGRTRGQLYLADAARGVFSADDEDLVLALVAGAAVAIENVELDMRAREREQWLAAASAATRLVLGGAGAGQFDPVPRSAQQSAGADFGVLVLLTEPDRLRVQAATGIFADELPGRLLDPASSLAGQVVRSARPLRTQGYPDAGDTHPPTRIGSVVTVPVACGDVVIGALTVGRLAGKRAFTGMDVHHLAGFAEHVGLAVELGHARTKLRERGPAEADRIAADLHEHVVQRLFAISLGLESLATINAGPMIHDRLTRYVRALDDSIDRIRSTVYGIDSTLGRNRPRSLQHQVLAAVEECTPALGLSVTTTFCGELDSSVPDAMADVVVDTVRQVLGSIAEHAHATRVELRFAVDADRLTIDIVDNGTETQAPGRADVVAPLRGQAQAHRGHLQVHTPHGGGTHLTWTARIT